MPELNKYFKTCDLAAASFVKTRNIKLIEIQRPHGEKNAFFVFDLSPQEGEKLVIEFLSGGAVPARPYASAIRDLKILVHNY